jgi:hypothetical protein
MWVGFTPRFDFGFASSGELALAFALVVAAGLVLQLGTYPRMGLSDQSVLGFWPSRLAPYTIHVAKSTRRKLIATAFIPFFVLAILPLLIAMVFRISTGWGIFCSCLAATLYGPNAFLAILSLRAPARCVIGSQGFQTYWRLLE